MIVKIKFPKGLSASTRRFMKEALLELNGKKAIRNVDEGALVMLATSYEMYLQASEEVMKNGVLTRDKYGESVPNPAQGIATKNHAIAMKIMTEYGLTVKSRSKIDELKEPKADESPLDALITKSIKKKQQ